MDSLHLMLGFVWGVPHRIGIHKVKDRSIEANIHDHVEIAVAKCLKVELSRYQCYLPLGAHPLLAVLTRSRKASLPVYNEPNPWLGKD
jgi:hypothetical protein